MITSKGIRYAKTYTLRGRSSTKLGQRLFKTWQSNNHHKNSSIPSKPDSAHICTIKYYDENIAHRDQTDKLVVASMSSLDKSCNATSDLYKGLNIITELLKEINNAIKDDPAINKKISEATESFIKIFANITEVLSLVKGFDFSDLQSTVKDLLAHALKQEEELAAWAKSSTNMAWNLGSRLSGLERALNHIQSSSVTPTLALTHIQANVEGENETNTAIEDPTSHTEGETNVNKQEKPEEPKHSIYANIEFIGSSTPQPSVIQAQPITIINPEPIVPQREGKGITTDEQVEDQRKLVKASSIAHMDKEDKIKKAEEEVRLLAINKPEVIKVVREEAKKLGIHPKEAIIAKADEKFKKAQDAEHEVSRGNTLRNRRYERIKKIPEELGIPSALPVPIPEQASSKSSRRKRKRMELEPEIKIPGLECNQTLPKNVPFVNNMVIEEPEYGIFFTDEFSDQAFQRWSDIDKVGMEALVSYLVAASMVQSPKNARFNMKLKKLIAEHPDQEKLKSKKVKLEALGYEMD
ncbi:hypothetical protein Tco_1561021 [Tanacetum coccineum]